MNERIKRLREYIFDKHHHALRRTAEEAGLIGLAEEMKAARMSYQMRAAVRLKRMLEAETPVILPDERIVVTRTIKDIPSFYTNEEWDEIAQTHYLHEKGDLCNISPNYEAMLRKGLETMLDEVRRSLTQQTPSNSPSKGRLGEGLRLSSSSRKWFASRRYRTSSFVMLPKLKLRMMPLWQRRSETSAAKLPRLCGKPCNSCASCTSAFGKPGTITTRWVASTNTYIYIMYAI